MRTDRRRGTAGRAGIAVALAIALGVILQHQATAGMGAGPLATAAKQAGPKDPVSGKKVKAKDAPVLVFLDAAYKFGSVASMEKFRAAPERYAVTTCPVCSGPVATHGAEHKSLHGNRTWYFCCADCQSKFDKTPAEYVTYRCPSCGGIAPVSIPGSVTADVKGIPMRFCCTSCEEKTLAEADAYIAILVPEGGGLWRRGDPQH